MENDLSFDQLPFEVNKLSRQLDNIERLLQQIIKNQSEETSDQLLTVQQTADFLSLSKPTIYSKVSRLELPFMKQGK